jgi:hypothetical protein
MGLHDCLCGVRDLDNNRLHPGAPALARPSHLRVSHAPRAVFELKSGAVGPVLQLLAPALMAIATIVAWRITIAHPAEEIAPAAQPAREVE